ncbi:MAG: phosphinothricin N-acetyltransferase [Hyphococcus sp.]|nr:MAG: phosphinothricin N-acetyltransferase [Marinicaulis sp.]
MVNVRPGEIGDLEALTTLYNHFVLETAITFDIEPFTPAQREPWFGQFEKTGPYRLLVAHLDGAHAGYATSTRHRAKPAYNPSIETTVYVDPKFARQKVGAALYEALFSALEGEDVHKAFAGVALPNEASVAFHQRFGFTEIGTFHEIGRKFGRFHDVMWFEKRL